MDRRLLFPAVAITAWAQQTSPATAEAEKALRDRVQQFYQFQVDKKYRQAEGMVAEESKDDYYNGRKPDIRGFEIVKVQFQDDGDTKALVTIKAKVLTLALGAAQVFDFASPTYWKLENGQWCWYIPAETKMATPFGTINTGTLGGARKLDTTGQAPGTIEAPDFAALRAKVTIDRESVQLDAKGPDQAVTITNGLPGPLDLMVDPHVKQIRGLSFEIDKTRLESGEKVTLHLRLTGREKISDTVRITASQVNRVFEIQVHAN